MKLEIKEKKENKLLGRLEVAGSLAYEKATPSNETVKERVAAELKVDKELVVMKHIYPKYGSREAEISAEIYESKEKKEKITKKKKKKEEKKAGKAKEEKKKEGNKNEGG